jgi:hypothetical protein
MNTQIEKKAYVDEAGNVVKELINIISSAPPGGELEELPMMHFKYDDGHVVPNVQFNYTEVFPSSPIQFKIITLN